MTTKVNIRPISSHSTHCRQFQGFTGGTQVVEEGAWAEGVSSALARLGVRVLDGSILPPAAMGSARALVNPATGCGVLSAISNAAGGDLGRIGRRMIAEGVTTEERQQLRAFLIQVRNSLISHLSS